VSDGPHKSLPMRLGWKKFAERGDKAAFEPLEIAKAAIPALGGDWQEEVAPYIDALRNVLGDDRQGSLLGAGNLAELEQLRRLNPGNSLWRGVVDGVAQAVGDGLTGTDALLKGVTGALLDRAARGVLQVEEHYLRKTNETRAANVRARLEEGIARANLEGMARQVLGLESRHGPDQPQKMQGLDDGVRF
jgi:hypothetical protein